MGVHTWSYEPEKCDGDYCPCNCDKCPKAYDGKHIPFERVFEGITGINLEEWRKEMSNDRND